MLCNESVSEAAIPGAPAARVDEARRAVNEVVELLGDLEYHFGVFRPVVEGGVWPADGGCSLYLISVYIYYRVVEIQF